MPPNESDILAALCRRQPFFSLGLGAYEAASCICARKFSSIQGVRAVYLRGNALKNCVPAISDLDFTVVMDISSSVSAQRDCILEWRKTYHTLKKTLWMLGEVVIEDPCIVPLLKMTASSLLFVEGERLSYQDGHWTFTPSSSPLIASQNRLFLSLGNFVGAQQMMAMLARGKNRSFYLGRLQRCLNKVIRFSGETNNRNSTESEPQALFARAEFIDNFYIFFVFTACPYIPKTLLPHFLRPLCQLNPIYPMANAMRSVWAGNSPYESMVPFMVGLVIVWTVLYVGWQRLGPLIMERSV